MRALFLVLLLGNLTLMGWIVARSYLGQGSASPHPASVSAPSLKPGMPESSYASGDSLAVGQGPEKPADASISPREPGQPPTQDQTNAPPTKTVCEVLGPFVESGLGEGILQQLESSGVSGEISELDVPAPSDYWVYFPPLPSRRAAMSQLAEFQRKKIDSFVITQGALVNGVSLGLFTKRVSADELVRRMGGLGYPARIQEVYRSRREFWINVKYADDGEPRTDLWSSLEAKFPLMQRRVEPCK